jgi:hypothetical protein
MVVDSLGDPLIAFLKSDGSVWLARGLDVVGVADEPSAPVPVKSVTTFVRGWLWVRQAGPAELRDLAGRCVMRLQPGANDMRGLDAGVYFLKSSPDVGTKLIITK